MIENRIRIVPTDSIVVPRETRQRTELTPESVQPLADTIAQSQWISPLLVDQETNEIIAGERRLTAVRLLAESPVPCKIQAWKKWTHIPVQYGHDLTPLEREAHEYWENAGRMDLTWQDKARAAFRIHDQCVREAKATDNKWYQHDTARLLGIDRSTLTSYIKCMQAATSGDDKLSSVITDSRTHQSAMQALDRIESRRNADSPLSLRSGIAAASVRLPPAATPCTQDNPENEAEEESSVPSAPASIGESLIRCADFTQWASSYTGQPFNFLHCDFPYGIEFNKSAGQGTAPDTKQQGQYDDSADTYWALLDVLASDPEQLLAPSCHIMFWFSQNFRRETEDFIAKHLPQFQVQAHLMVWHASDNSGLVPDANRYGRRTYETAMLLTSGDRKIVKPVALSVAAPRSSSDIPKLHRSQKPLEVLTHFFSMFVDDTTRMLDPTCGSATSVLAAHKAEAASTLGLEIDPEMRDLAVQHFDATLSRRELRL